MKRTLLLFLLSLSLNAALTAQRPTYKSKIGIHTGNHITVWGDGENESFKRQALLRYSIGIMGRQILKKDWRTDFFLFPVMKGEIALDYGVNFVFKGYQYKFSDITTHTDQLTIEVPLIFAFYDRRDVLIKKKWLRKGITSMTRIGFKPSFTTGDVTLKSVSNGNARLTETMTVRPFNFFTMIGIGIIQNKKNGRSSFVEIAYNHGVIKRNTGTITYENLNSSGSSTENFYHYGSYIAINAVYLFQAKRPSFLGKGKEPPKIYNPRFINP